MSLETLPPLRDVIAEHGLAARKSLGQNFLLDLNLTSKIARQAGDLSGHDVLEIGPGPGGLTRALLAEGARKVIAIEADPRCLPALDQISAAAPGRLQVLSGDALKLDPTPYLNGPVKIVANLPYNVGTELLVRWLTPHTWPPFWSSLTLMFQREVAERIVARPNSKTYGRLAILSQFRSDPEICFDLSPKAFSPPPKVTSAVVHMKARAEPRFPAEQKLLSEIVARAFNQRRKMLRASLKGLLPEVQAVLESVGIDPKRRAETVSLEEFCRLSEAVRAARA